MGLPVADAGGQVATTTGAIATTTATIATNTVSNAVDQAIATTDLTLEEKERQLTRGERFAKWVEEKAAEGKWYAQLIQSFADKKARWSAGIAEKRARWSVKLAKFTVQFNKFMQMIARFFPFIKVMMIIIMIFTDFLKYVMMAIAAIFIGLLIVLHKLLAVPGIYHIPMGLFWWFTAFIPWWITTVVYVALSLVILIFCLLLTIINFMSAGSLQNLIFCENSPTAWYKTVSHHLNNQFNRGFMCSKPCREGFAPSASGMFCIRNPKSQPDYCPQAQVMRLYTGVGRKDSKYIFPDFNTTLNMKYRTSMPADRETMLKEHFIQRQRFLETCNDKFKDLDYITLGICSNLDIIEKDNLYGLTKPEIGKLKNVCAQAFCTANKTYPFCAALSDLGAEDDEILLKMLVKFAISIIVFVIIFVTLVKIVKEF
jgi:hypothetical protein|uniref:Uncharacterized protein n=1 Tax=viral metagenome TaxID=1070528 RepID=A0A6C0BFJ0_9ZZZZ